MESSNKFLCPFKKPKYNEALELLWRLSVYIHYFLKPKNHEKLKKKNLYQCCQDYSPVCSYVPCTVNTSVLRPGLPLTPYSQFNQNDLSFVKSQSQENH